MAIWSWLSGLLRETGLSSSCLAGVPREEVLGRICRGLKANARAPVKAQVAVQKSNIPGAGQGLFALKTFTVGDFVAIYPGEFLPRIQTAMLYSLDGSARGTLFDLNPSQDYSYVLQLQEDGGRIDAREVGVHPIAVFNGHMVNHPPQGMKSMLETFEFFWEELPIETAPATWVVRRPWFAADDGSIIYIPANIKLPGVAFFATCTIDAGQEVLWNYRMKFKRGDRPEWYFDA